MKMAFAVTIIVFFLAGCTPSDDGMKASLVNEETFFQANITNETKDLTITPVANLIDLVGMNVSCEPRDVNEDGEIDAVRINIKPLKGWGREVVPVEGKLTITAVALVPLTSTVPEKGADIYEAKYKINQNTFKEGQGYFLTLNYASISNYSKYLPDYGVIEARFVSPGGLILEGETSTRYTQCTFRKPTQEVPVQYVS